jgi:hypothetical protein
MRDISTFPDHRRQGGLGEFKIIAGELRLGPTTDHIGELTDGIDFSASILSLGCSMSMLATIFRMQSSEKLTIIEPEIFSATLSMMPVTSP